MKCNIKLLSPCQVQKSCELVGYFVSPEVWVAMVVKNIKLSQSAGSLLVLGHVLRGSQRSALHPHLAELCAVLNDPAISRIADVSGGGHRGGCVAVFFTNILV